MDMNCCKFCGKVLERDDDGDRYWWLCPDIKCKFWEQGKA
jgi:hypothetical protein